MPHEDDEDEVIGFDEGDSLEADDLVMIRGLDGQVREHVLLAVVEYDGADYAVLVPRESLDDEDGDLLVTCFDEQADGDARFAPVDDETVVLGLREVLGSLVGLAPQAVGEA